MWGGDVTADRRRGVALVHAFAHVDHDRSPNYYINISIFYVVWQFTEIAGHITTCTHTPVDKEEKLIEY